MTKNHKIKPPTLEKQRQLLLTPCKTRDELKAWIKYFLNLNLPDTTVSRYSDTNPLDVVWECYRICVLKDNPDNIKDLLFVAGRGTGKCVKKGTKILTKSGIKSIEDVRYGDIVFTGWDWQPVKEFFDEGVKPGVTVSTTIGKYKGAMSLTGSLKHRVQVLSLEGEVTWKYLKDLTKDDYVYRSSKEHFEVNTDSRSFKEGWIIGNIIGDGRVQLDQKYSHITVRGNDLDQLNYLDKLISNYWGCKAHIKKNSTNSWNYSFYSKDLCSWFSSLVCSHLAYDKQLITINHSPNFLAGYISGLMETDGSKDSISLANKQLIEQISAILSVFGVVSSVNHSRKKPRFSQFTKQLVTYSSCVFKTRLPTYLMPLFVKREAFMNFANSMNEQYRFPSSILRNVGAYIKAKYCVANGWMTINGKRQRSTVPFSKELWGASKDKHSYIHKIKAAEEWLRALNDDKADYLNFVLNGYFEKVDSVSFQDSYFYDLEIKNTHSYWSNGFISHNTLGMAIAELMILLHDAREVVHVGAIQNQADRCYLYQKNFLYSKRIKPLVIPTDIPEEQRILEKANMSKSIFNVNKEKLALEVIPCTLKACLVSSTKAESCSGSKSLQEFVKDDEIKSVDGWIKIVSNTIDYAECLRIELEDGRVIEGTLDHKVLTDSGWVELKDLNDHNIL